MLTTKVREALAFARRLHEGQRRKHGLPYVTHPEDVAALLAFRHNVEDEDVLCAALLHDVLEDSNTTPQQLAEQFGPRVADIVAALTRDKSRSYEEYAQRLADQGAEVALIKAADMISNLRDSMLADEKTRRRAARHARQSILPLARQKLGDNHLMVRDLEVFVRLVENRAVQEALAPAESRESQC